MTQQGWTVKQIRELRYIGERGPLFQRVPYGKDPELMHYIAKGMVSYDERGYSLTEAGRRFVSLRTPERRCPCCGQSLPSHPEGSRAIS